MDTQRESIGLGQRFLRDTEESDDRALVIFSGIYAVQLPTLRQLINGPVFASDVLGYVSLLKSEMTRSHPHCDRHPNLQMVPCLLRRASGLIAGHACPVPGCGRLLGGDGFLGDTDLELVLAPGVGSGNTNAPKESSGKKRSSNNNASNQNRPLNRHAAARAAILKAIEQKQRP